MNKISMKELSKRIAVAAISIIILGLFIYFSQNNFFKPVFALLLTAVASVGLYEYIQLVARKNIILKKNLLIFSGVFQIFSFYLASQFVGFKLFPVFVFFLIIMIICLSRFSKIEGSSVYVGVAVFGIVYITIPLGLIFPILYNSGTDGRFWLVYVIAVTKMSDVGAYFVGKLFGKRKLAKNISPNKTIEGGIAGLLFSIGTSYLFYHLFNYYSNYYLAVNPFIFLILGAVLGIFGQVGDLAESLLKRDAEIKDSNTLPGLGGILDMLDSLLFSLPLFFFFTEVVI